MDEIIFSVSMAYIFPGLPPVLASMCWVALLTTTMSYRERSASRGTPRTSSACVVGGECEETGKVVRVSVDVDPSIFFAGGVATADIFATRLVVNAACCQRGALYTRPCPRSWGGCVLFLANTHIVARDGRGITCFQTKRHAATMPMPTRPRT